MYLIYDTRVKAFEVLKYDIFIDTYEYTRSKSIHGLLDFQKYKFLCIFFFFIMNCLNFSRKLSLNDMETTYLIWQCALLKEQIGIYRANRKEVNTDFVQLSFIFFNMLGVKPAGAFKLVH